MPRINNTPPLDPLVVAVHTNLQQRWIIDECVEDWPDVPLDVLKRASQYAIENVNNDEYVTAAYMWLCDHT